MQNMYLYRFVGVCSQPLDSSIGWQFSISVLIYLIAAHTYANDELLRRTVKEGHAK
jgi:hypothetical protein